MRPHADRVVVANVAGSAMANRLRAYTTERFGVAPEFVAVAPAAHGVTNSYAHPKRMGVDRWVAMIGAFHEYGGPVCVGDAGTAVTIDAVDADGKHLGGVIAPGTRLMRTSLDRATSDILLDEATRRAATGGELFATDTDGAVAAGTLYPLAALMDRALDELAARWGRVPRLVLTGGDAEHLAGAMRHPAELVPDLVLRGLAVFAGRKA